MSGTNYDLNTPGTKVESVTSDGSGGLLVTIDIPGVAPPPPPSPTITVNTPATQTAGAQFMVTGTLANYTAAPTLSAAVAAQGSTPTLAALPANQQVILTATGTFMPPPAGTVLFVEVWGPGSSGDLSSSGASGGYSAGNYTVLAADVTSGIPVTVGTGGAGGMVHNNGGSGPTWFKSTTTILANAAASRGSASVAPGGVAGVGTTTLAGTAGTLNGGGAGAPGPKGVGLAGQNGTNAATANGGANADGTAGGAGAGQNASSNTGTASNGANNPDGGTGGGGEWDGVGGNGGFPGAGGGLGGGSASGAGAGGQIRITWPTANTTSFSFVATTPSTAGTDVVFVEDQNGVEGQSSPFSVSAAGGTGSGGGTPPAGSPFANDPNVPGAGANGIPTLGWGMPFAGAPGASGLGQDMGSCASACGVPFATLRVAEDFSWDSSTASSDTNAGANSLGDFQGRLATYASGTGYTDPASQRHFCWGTIQINYQNNSLGGTNYSAAQLAAATVGDGGPGDWIVEWVTAIANAGYTTTNGYKGNFLMRLSWENDIPSTTPGGYQSGRTWPGGFSSSQTISEYAAVFIPAFRNIATILKTAAKQKNVPLFIIYNPTTTSGGIGWNPSDYPGDDVVDAIGVDSYTNAFWVRGSPCPMLAGYWAATQNSGPQKGFAVSGTCNNPSNTSDGTWWANYDQPAHWLDSADAQEGDTDGQNQDGFGFVKASDLALATGWYAGMKNPDGSARVAKPLCIPECGVNGTGPGPFSPNGNGYDPNFAQYLKSRIAWHQSRGGQVLFFVFWNGPSSTGITAQQYAAIGQAFGSNF